MFQKLKRLTIRTLPSWGPRFDPDFVGLCYEIEVGVSLLCYYATKCYNLIWPFLAISNKTFPGRKIPCE